MISANRYKIIADLINNAQDRGGDIITYFTNMINTLSDSEISENSIDRLKLEDQINATSDVMIILHQNYEDHMIEFVFVLQKYIDDNYSTVNDFLSDNNTQVLSVFAAISEAVGYPIDAANIEDIS